MNAMNSFMFMAITIHSFPIKIQLWGTLNCGYDIYKYTPLMVHLTLTNSHTNQCSQNNDSTVTSF